jgi:pyrimidine-specific ribonucleoside hydrolase
MKIKSINYISLLFTGIILFACQPGERARAKEEKSNIITVIFDTDFGPDYDDVGAITLLHAFADSGLIEILATVGSTTDSLLAPAMDAVNTYFGRDNLPIGVPEQGIYHPCAQGWNQMIIDNYPHDMDYGEAKNAIDVYRKALISQPDSSVTIVTVGFLTNLAHLLKSTPDKYSELNGKELVTRKVDKLVSMAGTFPEGKEFNIFKDSLAARYAIENWPTTVIFSGFEIGKEIRTGLPLINNENIQNSPVKDVFHHCITTRHWKGDENGRMSWDQTAVLVAAKGTAPYFNTVRGQAIAFEDGHNEWKDDPRGNHKRLTFKMSPDEIKNIIDRYMMHQPVK